MQEGSHKQVVSRWKLLLGVVLVSDEVFGLIMRLLGCGHARCID